MASPNLQKCLKVRKRPRVSQSPTMSPERPARNPDSAHSAPGADSKNGSSARDRSESESGADSEKASDESSPSDSQEEDYVPQRKVGTPQGSPIATRAARRRRGADALPAELSLSPPKKKKRVTWTDEEVKRLKAAVDKHGAGQWARMLQDQDFTFGACRNGVSLKDKWRNLQKPIMKKKKA